MTTPLDDAPELCRLSVAELTAGYAAGTISPMDVAGAALDRADTINPKFHAFTFIDHDGALTAASAAETRWRNKTPLSPLDGVPVTIKDIVRVKNWTVTYGSRTAAAGLCDQDAPAVAAWRAAGAVFIGQTTTPEFGWKAVTDSPRYGLTRNPWNPALTPGGSSGGAAVAAATGAGVLHLGSDGGGSIRIPAAFTGIAGIKPSFGLVPAFPASAFGTLAHIGPMARTIADLSAGLAAMVRRDVQDWHQAPAPRLGEPTARGLAGLRLGVWRDPPGCVADPEILLSFTAALQSLQAAGASLEPVTLQAGETLLETFETLWFSGAANRLRTVPASLRHLVDPGLLAIAERGAAYSAADYIAASTARAMFGAFMDALLQKFDALISPATAIQALPAGALVPDQSGQTYWHQWAGFSFPLNLSQQPACVVPFGKLASGIPASLQLIGARMEDAALLDIAAAVAAEIPSHPVH
jgi:amidase/aspartyl-tRNA(Asn)/glutamyl-tRNA(Gln) amidotransferase subunit A